MVLKFVLLSDFKYVTCVTGMHNLNVTVWPQKLHTFLSADSQSALRGFAPPAASPAPAGHWARSLLRPPLLLLLLRQFLHQPQRALWGWEEVRSCGCCFAKHGFCSASIHTHIQRQCVSGSQGETVMKHTKLSCYRCRWMLWPHTD